MNKISSYIQDSIEYKRNNNKIREEMTNKFEQINDYLSDYEKMNRIHYREMCFILKDRLDVDCNINRTKDK